MLYLHCLSVLHSKSWLRWCGALREAVTISDYVALDVRMIHESESYWNEVLETYAKHYHDTCLQVLSIVTKHLSYMNRWPARHSNRALEYNIPSSSSKSSYRLCYSQHHYHFPLLSLLTQRLNNDFPLIFYYGLLFPCPLPLHFCPFVSPLTTPSCLILCPCLHLTFSFPLRLYFFHAIFRFSCACF
jgi:hypothetical protein